MSQMLINPIKRKEYTLFGLLLQGRRLENIIKMLVVLNWFVKEKYNRYNSIICSYVDLHFEALPLNKAILGDKKCIML